jgi:hypothetical protein
LPYVPRNAAERRRLALFVGAVMVLDVLFNTRFPKLEVPLWYLLPSIDVVMLLAAFALAGSQGWRVPKVVLGVLTAVVVLVRILRFGDGVQDRYYAQKFTLYDLLLLPEGVRFAHSALPFWKFCAILAGCSAVLLLLPIVAYHALKNAAGYLADTKRVPLVGALALVAFGIGLAVPRKAHHSRLLTGGFGVSMGPRIRREAAYLWNVYTEREARLRAIAETGALLERTPSNLSKLARRNVHLVLVESYGVVAVERPDFVRALTPTFDSFEAILKAKGFTVASGRLISSTFGGRSWLAHVTLATAVRTTDQLGYDAVYAAKPKTLASFFRAAGYRTVLAAPGTTRAGTRGDPFGFNKNYYYDAFDYEGPAFAWATMPDQYVLEVIRRREYSTTSPLFVQYVLISSHAPWSETPTIVEDWSKLGNGAIFDTHPVLRFPIVWPNFDDAHEAYIRSIVYDFEVLKRFVAQFLNDDSLVVVLGDHQPVIEVSGNDTDLGVPVHVFSRAPELVAPFVQRGYVDGLWPRGSGTPRAMDTFLPDLLRDFSTGPPAH